MAGGYFTSHKRIPGAYVNFETNVKKGINRGDRGIVTMPLSLNWGKVRDFVVINSSTNFVKVLGYDITDSELLIIKETLKRAKSILLYRINSGTKASKTVDELTITAAHEGIRGNAITVKIAACVDVDNSFIVTTYLNGVTVDEQIADTIGSLENNDFVVFTGIESTTLTANVGIVLENGTNTEASSSDYTTYFTKCEVQEFNVMAIPTSDTTLKATAKAFSKRMIEDEGKKIQIVLPSYSTADHEGVLSVENGVILKDGTIVSLLNAVGWVAGATASAAIYKDLTYSEYEDAVDVTEKYTNTQIETMLDEGKFFFVPKKLNGKTKIVVQEDINTFTSFTTSKGQEFSYNRSVRTMFDIGSTIPQLWEQSYIGQVNATNDGICAFKGDLIKYFTNLQELGAIKNYKDSDINVSLNNDNSVYANIALQVVKAFKKLYMQVLLK